MPIYSVLKLCSFVKKTMIYFMNLGLICSVACTFTKYLMHQYILLLATLKHDLEIVG